MNHNVGKQNCNRSEVKTKRNLATKKRVYFDLKTNTQPKIKMYLREVNFLHIMLNQIQYFLNALPDDLVCRAEALDQEE